MNIDDIVFNVNTPEERLRIIKIRGSIATLELIDRELERSIHGWQYPKAICQMENLRQQGQMKLF